MDTMGRDPDFSMNSFNRDYKWQTFFPSSYFFWFAFTASLHICIKIKKALQAFHACAAEFTEALMTAELFSFDKIKNKNIELALPSKKKI